MVLPNSRSLTLKKSKQPFEFGFNDVQSSLFGTREEHPGDAPEASTSGEDGSNPILPLQLQPKQLRLQVISHQTAKNIWLTKHYLKRDYSNPALEFGVFSPDLKEIVGAISFSARLGGSVLGGTPHIWEIRRMWLSDERCAKNSESRVLAISCRMIKKLAPHVRQIVSYADRKKQGHKGTIYRAAGFVFDGWTLNGKNPVMSESKEVKGWLTHGSHQVGDGWAKARFVKYL